MPRGDDALLVIPPFEENGSSEPFEADELRLQRLLASLPREVSLDAVIERPGCYRLSAGPVAGVFVAAGTQIEIRPKLPISQLLFLVGYAQNQRFWRDCSPQFEENTSVVDAIASAVARQAIRALTRGRLFGYVDLEDSLRTVRGRIQMGRQVSRWQGRLPPVEVAFQEYTDDILELRLLKAAVAALVRWPIRQPGTWAALRHVDAMLAPVSLVQFQPSTVPNVIYTRLNQHYRTAVELARLVLRLSAFESRSGQVRASGLLVDMNKVFQDFVEVALGEALASFGISVRGQDTRHGLDVAGDIRLKPDLVLESRGQPILVADAKYKRLELKGLPNADIYQALAYAVGLNLGSAVLVYPATEAARADHVVRNTGTRVMVRTLDLALESHLLLGQVLQLATEAALNASVATSPVSRSIA